MKEQLRRPLYIDPGPNLTRVRNSKLGMPSQLATGPGDRFANASTCWEATTACSFHLQDNQFDLELFVRKVLAS